MDKVKHVKTKYFNCRLLENNLDNQGPNHLSYNI